MNEQADRTALVDLAVESWKFARAFMRVVSKLDAGDKSRHESQARWYVKRLTEALDAAGLRLVNVENKAYDPGDAAKPLNLEDFGPDDVLVVDQMIEPIIMSGALLVRPGTVLLRKATS